MTLLDSRASVGNLPSGTGRSMKVYLAVAPGKTGSVDGISKMAPFLHAQKFLVHKMRGSSGAACCKRRNLLLSTRWCHLLPLSIIYHSVLAQIRTEDVRSLKLKSKRREQEHGWNGWETRKEKILLLSLRFTFRCRSAQTLHKRKLNSFNSSKGKACANCLLLVRVSFEWCGKRDTASCFTFLYWSAQNCLCSGPLARISSDVDLFKRSSRYRRELMLGFWSSRSALAKTNFLSAPSDYRDFMRYEIKEERVKLLGNIVRKER